MPDLTEQIAYVEVVAGEALKAQADGAADWRGAYAKAFDAASTFCRLYEGPEKARLWNLANVLMHASSMVRDEQVGARSHFWVRPAGRPPLSENEGNIRACYVLLVVACRARIKREGLTEDPFVMAQTYLRRGGLRMTQSELRIQYSNAQRLSREMRSLIKNTRQSLTSGETTPSRVIDWTTRSILDRK